MTELVLTLINLLLLALLVLTVWALFTIRSVIVYEHQRGLLFRDGKFVRVLEPGRHLLFARRDKVEMIDIREQTLILPGQELLSADQIALKISLAVTWRVTDPRQARLKTMDYLTALHTALQLNLRDVVGGQPVDDLLVKRAELGRAVFEKSTQRAAEIGLELLDVSLRDIMFPGELKNIFAKVVSARKEGLASLERARGETAALRSLANAARMLEDNPNLKHLRMIQMLEGKSGNTIVLMSDDLAATLPRAKTE